VLLLSMASSEDLYRRCCRLYDQTEPQESAVHPAFLIKLLLGDVGGKFQVLGGPWYKMAELSYVCEGKVETLVFLLPDVWRIEEGAPLPANLCLVTKPSPGLALCPHTSTTKEAFEKDEWIKKDKKQRGRDDRRRERFQEREEGEQRRIGRRRLMTMEKRNRGRERESKKEVEMLGAEGITCEKSDCLIKRNVLSCRVLLPCVFFDRQLTGSVRRADLHNLLLSLGLWLTPTKVQELLNKVCVEGQLEAAAVTNMLLWLKFASQEGLSCRLEKAALRRSSYKKLKEDAGHMIALIHKIQKMVEK
ncbi:unnamed protein product, partial [Coregonus sp. 'balchen']